MPMSIIMKSPSMKIVVVGDIPGHIELGPDLTAADEG